MPRVQKRVMPSPPKPGGAKTIYIIVRAKRADARNKKTKTRSKLIEELLQYMKMSQCMNQNIIYKLYFGTPQGDDAFA
jgi:hypothetical protein